MKSKQTVLLAVLALSLAGCTISVGTEEANNCSIWEDEYFTFIPTSNQLENPHGYFTEVVQAQNNFIRKLELLPSTSPREDDLIRDLLDGNRTLESGYKDQRDVLSPGQTRDEFLGALSETEFEAWVADGEELASATQEIAVVFENYAAFCSEQG